MTKREVTNSTTPPGLIATIQVETDYAKRNGFSTTHEANYWMDRISRRMSAHQRRLRENFDIARNWTMSERSETVDA
jgi:hypothetical protein